MYLKALEKCCASAVVAVVAFSATQAIADPRSNSDATTISQMSNATTTGYVQTDTVVSPGDPQQPSSDFGDYLVLHQRLTHFLASLTRDTGARIDISSEVRGTLVDVRLQGDVEKILTTLARQFDLDWFHFNGVYYLSAKFEATTRLIRLGETTAQTARDALDSAGLNSGRFAIREASNGTAIAMSGPPKLLGMSEALIESLPTSRSAIAAGSQIVVRRGTQISIEPFPPIATDPQTPSNDQQVSSLTPEDEKVLP